MNFDKLDHELLHYGRNGKAIIKIMDCEWQLIFLPNEFMERHPANQEIKPHVLNGKPLCSAFTLSNQMCMWRRNLGPDTYAIPVFNRFKNEITGRIKGELYAIRPSFLLDLDSYHHSGVEFIRIRTDIVVPYRKRTLTTTIGWLETDEVIQINRAWMYVGVNSYWEDHLDGGLLYSRVQHFEPLAKEGKWPTGTYFYFSLNEYKNSPYVEEDN